MASSNGSLRQRLNNDEYKRWLLAGQGLLAVKDALVPFCNAKMRSFHNQLVTKNSNKQCQNLSCQSENMKFEKKVWKLSNPCPSKVCEKWLADIIFEHAGKSSNKVYWTNGTMKNWPISFWDVAKVYMERGQKPSNKGPSDSDTSGLLTLVSQCKILSSNIKKKESLNMVKNARNCIMHSPALTLTEVDFLQYMDTMIELMEDETQLKSLPECQAAVAVLNELKKMQIDITDQSMLSKLAEDEVKLIKEVMLHLEERLTNTEEDQKVLREDLNTVLNMVALVGDDHNLFCVLKDQVSNLMSCFNDSRTQINNVSDRVTVVEEQSKDLRTKLENLPDMVKQLVTEAGATGGSPSPSNFKNQLQEYCQEKGSTLLPKYTKKTSESGKGTYSEVNALGKTFRSRKAHPRKVDAEQDAARVALCDLGLLVSDGSGQTSSPEAQPTKEVIEEEPVSQDALSSTIKSRDDLNSLFQTKLHQPNARFKLTKKTTDVSTQFKAHISCCVPHVILVENKSIKLKAGQEEAANQALTQAGWTRATYSSDKEALHSQCGMKKVDLPMYAHIKNGDQQLSTLVRAGCISGANLVNISGEFLDTEEKAIENVSTSLLKAFEDLKLEDLEIGDAEQTHTESTHLSNATTCTMKMSAAQETFPNKSKVEEAVPSVTKNTTLSTNTSASGDLIASSNMAKKSKPDKGIASSSSKLPINVPKASSVADKLLPIVESNPKGKLLEYCSKTKLQKPVIDTLAVAEGKFKGKITMTNVFTLDKPAATVKEAEKQIAAQTLMKILKQECETATAKNKLQEYAQKNKFENPEYKTNLIEDKKYSASVCVKFIICDDDSYATKKEAEKQVCRKTIDQILPK